MLVRSRMTPDVLTVTPTTTLGEALRITREHAIRHLPVLDGETLVGLVSDRDLRLAAPPVWASGTDYDELRATFERKTVGEVMTAQPVIWTTEDTPIEEAASVLAHYKIGCLPVMRGDHLVGILTETDVMHAFVELFGTDAASSRIEVRIGNRPGELARVVRAVGVDFKCNITGLVVAPVADSNEALAILRISTREPAEIVEHLRNIGYKVGTPSIDVDPGANRVREREVVRHWGGDGF